MNFLNKILLSDDQNLPPTKENVIKVLNADKIKVIKLKSFAGLALKNKTAEYFTVRKNFIQKAPLLPKRINEKDFKLLKRNFFDLQKNQNIKGLHMGGCVYYGASFHAYIIKSKFGKILLVPNKKNIKEITTINNILGASLKLPYFLTF